MHGYGIDRADERTYIDVMAKNHNKTFQDADLKRLEFSLDELIRMCERLQQENSRLRNEQMRLKAERTMLIKKNELSKKRMEAIVTRLKSMELEL
jgi:cell division protein ZapB